MNGDGPLVSIGVPTFNRAATLPRTLESALAQTHRRLEIVVSDNASSDATREICDRYAAQDSRVRYLRQPENVGPTANFNTLFAECRGDFVMMLADDDWIDRGYVAACVASLLADPGCALAAGLARYYRDGRAVGDGVVMTLDQTEAPARVAAYYAGVEDNGTFYGLMPRRVLAAAAPLPNVLGNDWLLIGRIAFLGRVRTLPDVAVHRALDGTSAGVDRIVETFGAPSFQAWAPHLVIASAVLRDIGWANDVYAPAAAPARLALAIRAAWSVIDWRSLAWHATFPLAAAVGRRPGGAVVLGAYLRLTRALGAGQPSGRR
ncbi:MAG TPA: glycosyltransferase family 2 protein [Solirubrobacteraceae bacterium]|nr:glycosyltransferase family 2 protein [Solirubrobacteraceae bacterium]